MLKLIEMWLWVAASGLLFAANVYSLVARYYGWK